MDFRLTVEQQALTDSVARFAAKDYGFEARRRIVAAGRGIDPVIWGLFADLGWLGAGVSEAAGGFGGGAMENALLMEGFGRALVIEPFLASAILATQCLAALPSAPLRDSLLAQAIGGETILAVAHGEAAGRGDPDYVATSAVKSAAGWRLSGHKSLVLGAPLAHRLLVSARCEDGIGLFLLAPGASGLRLQRYRTLDNQHVGDLWLEEAEAEALLAAPGEAAGALQCGLDHALVGVCAEAVGAMDAAIAMTADYLRTRQQFGQTLNNFQALQHRMADMLVETELSRSILYQGLAALEMPPSARIRALSAMKAIISSAALLVGRQAVQLHGAIGMTEDYAIGHMYRRLYVIAGQFGGESLHLKRFAARPESLWPDVDVCSESSEK